MSGHIKLGAFELRRPLGRGGMGVVWQAYHPETGMDVAIKVLIAEQTRARKVVEDFQNEVRAVAAMDHPNVILVLDQGEVSPSVEKRSGGMFVAGSPFLVMELCQQGSLKDLVRPLDWEHVRYILFSLLDALAHAHARGVVHRDIKPANVLIASKDDPRPGLKLTDFGIAQAIEHRIEAGNTEASTGTPHYMAPEQLNGQWRDYGPWTDLYALGCLATWLISGRTPYQGNNIIQLIHAHMTGTPPPLEPQRPVPSGVEAWIRRLMARDPWQRFRCAADAAWALTLLDDASYAERPSTVFEAALRGQTLHPQQLRALSLPSWDRGEVRPFDTAVDATIVDASAGVQLDTMNIDTGDVDRDAARPDEPGDAAQLQPPMPVTWRRPQHDATPMRLVGAGLGLYGLRTIPLVGRQQERDALWGALREVHKTGRAQLVLLSGAAGTGKSRLVEWIEQRAKEFGAAQTLHALHSEAGSPTDGLAPMIARHMRVRGLTHQESLTRVERHLRRRGVEDPYEWRALTELISPMDESARANATAIIRFAGPKERYALLARELARLGRRRPVIVRLDDVQWGSDALSFAEYLMSIQSASPCPALVVLTARDEALAERPQEQAALQSVLSKPGTRFVPIQPLPVEARRALVQELLGLEGELAAQVETRTAGNPLFAVQLVGDWVQRGVLEIGDNGFVLRPGERASIPDDLHMVWTAHLRRVLDGLPQDALPAIEIAAALGREVSNSEWHATCANLGVTLLPGMLSVLFAARLAIPNERGWGFAHSMLHESVMRLSREAGRLQRHHRACALTLTHHASDINPQARIGHHHLEAGDLALALSPLLEGTRVHRDAGQYRAALDLLTRREAAMNALGLAEGDPRWAQGWLLRAWLERLQWQFDEARQWADKARRHAMRCGDEAILAEALWGLAWTLRQQGDRKQADELYRHAQDRYQRLGDALGVAQCLKGLAISARQRAELDQAGHLFEEARALYNSVDDINGVASCLYGLGTVAHRAKHPGRAEVLLRQAYDLHQRHGDQHEMANCLNVMAEIARAADDLPRAAEGYRAALQIHEAIDTGGGIIPRLNLCIVLIESRRYLEARTSLEDALAIVTRSGQRALEAFVHLALALCAAGAADWPRWSHHMPVAIEMLEETQMVDHDVAHLAQIAADLASDAQRPREAQQAQTLADQQRAALGA